MSQKKTLPFQGQSLLFLHVSQLLYSQNFIWKKSVNIVDNPITGLKFDIQFTVLDEHQITVCRFNKLGGNRPERDSVANLHIKR